ncbi:hypothetical protein CDD83_9278 [Cordyceps sp. RAO-2017]|nr:hypothetical protein CDD83_9278 [Cordyceps sp. RAO-2017]
MEAAEANGPVQQKSASVTVDTVPRAREAPIRHGTSRGRTAYTTGRQRGPLDLAAMPGEKCADGGRCVRTDANGTRLLSTSRPRPPADLYGTRWAPKPNAYTPLVQQLLSRGDWLLPAQHDTCAV